MKTHYAAGSLAVLGVVIMTLPIGHFPTMAIPRNIEPQYRYDRADNYPDCQQFCAPVDCLGSIACFKEAKRIGCNPYGEFGCASCPVGSDCYQYNLAQDARFQAYVDEHWPAETDTWRLARIRLGVGLVLLLAAGIAFAIIGPPTSSRPMQFP